MPAPVLPTEPANGLTCGIDWARDDHAVAVVDDRGRRCSEVPSSTALRGCGSWSAVLGRIGVVEVAIERPDGPVVDALLGAGITVVVISPNQLKNLRSRYGSAGNKDDRFDAFVLADTLRTDRARLRPLVPDSPATVALRATCRARKDLVAHRVAVANQLREHLKPRLPRRRRLVRRHRLPDQPGVPDPLRLPGSRRLADAQTPRRLAGLGGLLRPGRPRRPARPPDRRPPRRHRRRRRRSTPTSPAPCWPP